MLMQRVFNQTFQRITHAIWREDTHMHPRTLLTQITRRPTEIHPTVVQMTDTARIRQLEARIALLEATVLN